MVQEFQAGGNLRSQMAGKEAPGGDVNHVSTMAPEVGMAELAGTLGSEAGVRARSCKVFLNAR